MFFSCRTAEKDFAVEGAMIAVDMTGSGFCAEFANGWNVRVYWDANIPCAYNAETYVWRVMDNQRIEEMCESYKAYQSPNEVRATLEHIAVIDAHEFNPNVVRGN